MLQSAVSSRSVVVQLGCCLTLTLILLLSACASSEAPTLSAGVPSTADYVIQPGDKLDIKFYYQPELNETVVVRPDGKISLQLVSETTAVGQSPAQLREVLVGKYAPEIKRPEIAVIVRSFASQKVFVDGEVLKPGVVQMARPLTVLQAISSAGGVRDSAYLKGILVIRHAPSGRPEFVSLNLKNVVNGIEPEQDVLLSPLDVVYVPRSSIANVNLWIDRYIRRNLPIPFAFTSNP